MAEKSTEIPDERRLQEIRDWEKNEGNHSIAPKAAPTPEEQQWVRFIPKRINVRFIPKRIKK